VIGQYSLLFYKIDLLFILKNKIQRVPIYYKLPRHVSLPLYPYNLVVPY
jgi:hypothetical protein